MSTEAATSYEWWQQTGWGWYSEVRHRRLVDDLYERQEAFLSDFFRREAERCMREERRPLRVLEYGCGFGRHLRYLHRIEGLEVHGCDQSPGMLAVAGTLLFGRYPELKERVVLIEPDARLPYEDGWFDVAYTVSVLLHMPPESVAGRVAELRRVARRTFHLEPPSTPASYLWHRAHNGCWLHDILGIHQAAGACAVAVDADAIDPRAVVYRVEPASERSVGMQVGGRRCGGEDEVRAAMVEAILDYARESHERLSDQLTRVREQMGEDLRKKAAALVEARNEVQRLSYWRNASRKPLFRAASWMEMHPVAERAATGLIRPFVGARRLVLRLLGKRRPEPPAPAAPSDAPAAPPIEEEVGHGDGH